MRHLILSGCLALSSFLVVAQSDDVNVNKVENKIESKPYIMPWTYEVAMRSDIQNQDYGLIIRFPPGYEDEAKESFPVIYILDGQYHYPLVSAAHGNYAWDGTIENAITVGITWTGEDLNIEELRQINFTPSESQNRKPSGSANIFLRVLKEEIIPFIDKHYKTNDDRTLTGSSYSGLFAFYAMLNEPGLFNNIVALSPSLWWENRELDDKIKAYFANENMPSTRLYFARGEYELYGMKANDTLFTDIIGNIKGNSSVKYDVIEGAGHSGVNPQGFAKGLRHVFGRNELPISEQEKQRMIGLYTSDSKMMPSVELKSDASGLYFDDGQSNKIYIRSHSPSQLYVNEFNANISFTDLKDKKYQQIKVSPLNQGDIIYTRP